MNIGFLIFHKIDGRGGLENALVKTVEYLTEQGDSTHLFFWEETLYPEFLTQFQHVDIINRNGREIINYRYLPKFMNRKLQKKHDYHQMESFFHSKIIPLKLDILIIIDLPDTLVFYQPIFEKYKKIGNTAILSWIHGSIGDSTAKQIQRTKALLPIFNGHLTVSQGIASELTSIYGIHNTIPIRNPIDAADIIPRGYHHFIYIGRIGDPRKQVNRLIEALPALKGDWKLEIFGSAGSSEKDQVFQEKIIALNIQEHIIFHGWVNSPWNHIKKASALLLNSYTEGFGLVLAEAMMRGIPCISSDCPVGPREIVKPGVNGWLYKVGQEVELIKILQSIIDDEHPLPDALSIQESISHYRADIALQDFRKQLQKILSITEY